MGNKISKPNNEKKPLKIHKHLCQQCEEESRQRFDQYDTFNLENTNNYSEWEKKKNCETNDCSRYKK